ncbi:hypothetical protein DBV15_11257 [Temnothorax longispinosus]|uniref:Uncharacterized protein n=1 Tax=Temnothorax longispinosus TaxID=300112 RepID=A0A4S2K916_9HYME|nr:hypothetical protein DBV15_11257 [Temnothorax longispinosus]
MFLFDKFPTALICRRELCADCCLSIVADKHESSSSRATILQVSTKLRRFQPPRLVTPAVRCEAGHPQGPHPPLTSVQASPAGGLTLDGARCWDDSPLLFGESSRLPATVRRLLSGYRDRDGEFTAACNTQPANARSDSDAVARSLNSYVDTRCAVSNMTFARTWRNGNAVLMESRPPRERPPSLLWDDEEQGGKDNVTLNNHRLQGTFPFGDRATAKPVRRRTRRRRCRGETLRNSAGGMTAAPRCAGCRGECMSRVRTLTHDDVENQYPRPTDPPTDDGVKTRRRGATSPSSSSAFVRFRLFSSADSLNTDVAGATRTNDQLVGRTRPQRIPGGPLKIGGFVLSEANMNELVKDTSPLHRSRASLAKITDNMIGKSGWDQLVVMTAKAVVYPPTTWVIETRKWVVEDTLNDTCAVDRAAACHDATMRRSECTCISLLHTL